MNKRIYDSHEARLKSKRISKISFDQLQVKFHIHMSASEIFHSDPREQNHSRVMIDVKERDVRLFLLQNEKHRVELRREIFLVKRRDSLKFDLPDRRF